MFVLLNSSFLQNFSLCCSFEDFYTQDKKDFLKSHTLELFYKKVQNVQNLPELSKKFQIFSMLIQEMSDIFLTSGKEELMKSSLNIEIFLFSYLQICSLLPPFSIRNYNSFLCFEAENLHRSCYTILEKETNCYFLQQSFEKFRDSRRDLKLYDLISLFTKNNSLEGILLSTNYIGTEEECVLFFLRFLANPNTYISCDLLRALLQSFQIKEVEDADEEREQMEEKINSTFSYIVCNLENLNQEEQEAQAEAEGEEESTKEPEEKVFSPIESDIENIYFLDALEKFQPATLEGKFSLILSLVELLQEKTDVSDRINAFKRKIRQVFDCFCSVVVGDSDYSPKNIQEFLAHYSNKTSKISYEDLRNLALQGLFSRKSILKTYEKKQNCEKKIYLLEEEKIIHYSVLEGKITPLEKIEHKEIRSLITYLQGEEIGEKLYIEEGIQQIERISATENEENKKLLAEVKFSLKTILENLDFIQLLENKINQLDEKITQQYGKFQNNKDISKFWPLILCCLDDSKDFREIDINHLERNSDSVILRFFQNCRSLGLSSEKKRLVRDKIKHMQESSLENQELDDLIEEFSRSFLPEKETKLGPFLKKAVLPERIFSHPSFKEEECLLIEKSDENTIFYLVKTDGSLCAEDTHPFDLLFLMKDLESGEKKEVDLTLTIAQLNLLKLALQEGLRLSNPKDFYGIYQLENRKYNIISISSAEKIFIYQKSASGLLQAKFSAQKKDIHQNTNTNGTAIDQLSSDKKVSQKTSLEEILLTLIKIFFYCFLVVIASCFFYLFTEKKKKEVVQKEKVPEETALIEVEPSRILFSKDF